MKKSTMIITLAASLSGCSPLRIQPLDANAASSLRGQTLTYTVRKKPDFAAKILTKATFGMLGVFSMFSAGNEIISDDNIADPAEFISLGLIESLGSENALKLITPPSEVDDMDTEKIIAATENARFNVDVKTISW
jgi:hypothetical protein